jgi:Catechol dioxygenase N terminus
MLSSLPSLRQTRTYHLCDGPFILFYVEALRGEGRRTRFIFKNLITKLHEFISETKCVFLSSENLDPNHVNVMSCSITTEEWMTAIQFLTRTGQTCTPLRQEFILLSDVLGVSAFVDALNNPTIGQATDSSVLGPFFTADAPDGSFFPSNSNTLSPLLHRLCRSSVTVPFGESIASEGKGEYLYVEGRVLTTGGEGVPDAVIETWETDDRGESTVIFAPRPLWGAFHNIPIIRFGRVKEKSENLIGSDLFRKS